MSKTYDVMIIGGGAAGSIAAHSLVKAGLQVLMIDGGFDNSAQLDHWPETSFENLRRSDSFQRRLFLGEDFSALHNEQSDSEGKNTKGQHSVQMTKGFKSYVTERADELLPIHSQTVSLMQSLARGGFAEAWGAVCDFFDAAELKSIGIAPSEIQKMYSAYQRVCDVIGVSGKSDVRKNIRLQPPTKLDSHGRALLHTATTQKQKFKNEGLSVYQPPLAVLTKSKKGRQPTQYTDLDFWVNTGKSVFRPHYLLDELKYARKFTYEAGWLVDKIHEEKTGIKIFAKKIQQKNLSQKITTFSAKKVLLAAGSVNSTRIVLKSLGLYNTPVPIFVKPHVIMPCIHLRTVGKAGDVRRLSLCQLVMKHKPSQDQPLQSYAQLYSYKSLLLYKLLPNIPLPAPLALRFLAMFAPSFVLADTRFTTPTESAGEMQLCKKTGKGNNEFLSITYTPHAAIKEQHKKDLRKMKHALRQLGLWPLKEVFMPTGSAAHYAGGMPMQNSEENQSATTFSISTNSFGKIDQLKHTYVADASSWCSLPAKPPTLTIMANAYRVAQYVSASLKKHMQ